MSLDRLDELDNLIESFSNRVYLQGKYCNEEDHIKETLGRSVRHARDKLIEFVSKSEDPLVVDYNYICSKGWYDVSILVDERELEGVVTFNTGTGWGSGVTSYASYSYNAKTFKIIDNKTLYTLFEWSREDKKDEPLYDLKGNNLDE